MTVFVALVTSVFPAAARSSLHRRLVLGFLATLYACGAFADENFAAKYPVPKDHLRIVTWNLEVFNLRNKDPFHKGEPYGPRTATQLDKLAKRLLGFNAAIMALQEINDVAALYGLQDRLNGGAKAGGPWKIFPPRSEKMQQNALLYDDSKVDLVSAAFVSSTPSAGQYPSESGYRSPVTGIFTPKGNPNQKFRIIGIHGSWQNATIRKQQGRWLSAYVSDLLGKADEPKQIILAGDMNGAPEKGQGIYDGVVSGGSMKYVPKRNGESTTVVGGLKLDSFYLSKSVVSMLTNWASFVIRNDFYREAPEDFRKTCSDHFPVFIDYAYRSTLPTSSAK